MPLPAVVSTVKAARRGKAVIKAGSAATILLSALVGCAFLLVIFPLPNISAYSLFHRFRNIPTTHSHLTVVTLSFNQTVDHDFIEHNCAMISRTRHHFQIYTDDLSRRYCSVCECIKFVKKNCSCPDPDQKDCPLCEKLHFMTEKIPEKGELLFLDNDLIILKEEFLDYMHVRSRVHDVLAEYGHFNRSSHRYYTPLNSGLLFIRALPDLDYEEMKGEQYFANNNDQNAISRFVFDKYKNWDSLSLKWHCRFLQREGFDIPYDECYTLHDRREWPSIMSSLNKELLRVA